MIFSAELRRKDSSYVQLHIPYVKKNSQLFPKQSSIIP
jgi:hypothetical protein